MGRDSLKTTRKNRNVHNQYDTTTLQTDRRPADQLLSLPTCLTVHMSHCPHVSGGTKASAHHHMVSVHFICFFCPYLSLYCPVVSFYCPNISFNCSHIFLPSPPVFPASSQISTVPMCLSAVHTRVGTVLWFLLRNLLPMLHSSIPGFLLLLCWFLMTSCSQMLFSDDLLAFVFLVHVSFYSHHITLCLGFSS